MTGGNDRKKAREEIENKMTDDEKEELFTLIASSAYKNLNIIGYLKAILGVSVIIAVILILLLIKG